MAVLNQGTQYGPTVVLNRGALNQGPGWRGSDSSFHTL